MDPESTVPIRCGSDPAAAQELILRVLSEVVGEYTEYAKTSWSQMTRKYLIEDASVEPLVTLIATDNWLSFTARYVVDCRRRRTTSDTIFRRLVDEIAKTEGRIALASATVEIVGAPPIRVGIQGKPPVD